MEQCVLPQRQDEDIETQYLTIEFKSSKTQQFTDDVCCFSKWGSSKADAASATEQLEEKR